MNTVDGGQTAAREPHAALLCSHCGSRTIYEIKTFRLKYIISKINESLKKKS